MGKILWRFTDDKGSFASDTADQINSLYFPLCNSYPIMSSVSCHLRGDIKTDFNSFLLDPVSRISLGNSKINRNFWIYINPRKIWSTSGLLKDFQDIFTLEAGLLWQKITRKNKKIGLKSEITSFIPVSGEPLELMLVDITNMSLRPIKFIPTAAIPIFGRSANNLHDHRHVTSLLQRIKKDRFGVIVKPTLTFNESGHIKNKTNYFVFGIDQKYNPPQYIYPTQEEFIGDNSDLETPNAVFNNVLPLKNSNIQGKEAMAGLRFKTNLLKPEQTASYIILMGITNDETHIRSIFNKFNTRAKVQKSLEDTKMYWQQKSSEIKVNTGNSDFDNWLKWVSIQPGLRKIFGCSFLPDFDYGKGGRGWRDLWQDCLALILNSPRTARPLLINNLSGVRIDGSNATIIGKNPGEFIADRNNISRVWMDHAAWPLFTMHLYIHQTGDLKILLEETTYFKDYQLSRSQTLDQNWKPEYGNKLKTKTNRVYKGSVLEHILVENLVQFFNVGPHNHCLLEGADWNDGLDMAREFGESVSFSCLYAQNLSNLCEIIARLSQKNISILKELKILLDSLTENKINYSDINAKRRLLKKYFQSVNHGVSGKRIAINKAALIHDLKHKSDWISAHIRNNEWLKEGFFNGYYNNDKQRVEGNFKGKIRMTLTGQTFPIMSGIATSKQTKTLIKNVWKYLRDKKLGGLHLNTEFKGEQLNLGRAFSFAYGDKENGAIFNHMCLMFAYALYKQGFVNEGYEIISSIYKMSVDTAKSKIYPCLPEYFNAEGRGMYSYLTGSASWFMFILLTQVFGIRGEYGDLTIEPKLTASQFKDKITISISTNFANKALEIRFTNPPRKSFSNYSIRKVIFNKATIFEHLNQPSFFMSRQEFLSLAKDSNIIEVLLY